VMGRPIVWTRVTRPIVSSSIHPSLIAEKFQHDTSQSYKNRPGQKAYLTLIFAHEECKHNITNDKIQNQKNQHYRHLMSHSSCGTRDHSQECVLGGGVELV